METTTTNQTRSDFHREQAELDQERERVNKAAIPFALSHGRSPSGACRYVGITLATFYQWLESDPAFAERVTYARMLAIDNMEALAYHCAEKAEDDPRYQRALFFWLTHRAGWVKAKPALEHTTPDHAGIRPVEPVWPHTPARPAPTEPPSLPESLTGDGHGDSSGDGIPLPPIPSINHTAIVGAQHAAPAPRHTAPT